MDLELELYLNQEFYRKIDLYHNPDVVPDIGDDLDLLLTGAFDLDLELDPCPNIDLMGVRRIFSRGGGRNFLRILRLVWVHFHTPNK